MQSLPVLFLLSSLVVFSFASFVFRPAHQCVRQNKCISHDFKLSGDADLNEQITLSFAVKRANVDQLFQVLESVSNPNNKATYGKYLTPQQVREMTANPEATDLVVEFLSKFVDESSIHSRAYGGFIEVDTDVKTAQQILRTSYHKFYSAVGDKEITRVFSFELPLEISKVVDYIFPTIQFPPTYAGKPIITSSAAPNANSVTPSVLNSYYNITSNTVTQSNATQSLFEALGQSYSPDDLTQFQTMFNLPKDALDTVIGNNNPNVCVIANKCAEASLDVQYIMAVAQLAPTTFWSEPRSLGDIFYKWIVEVADTENPPLVHSISYGSIEDELETDTQDRFSQEVASLGASGVTIVVSSGDDGVANYGARSDASQCGFHPSYPATCPYVVAVGATQGPESNEPEVACQSDNGGVITTGGGFSTTFSQPSYQTTEVTKFLSNSTACPDKSLFASTGRGYPDVSMAGYNYEVVIGGRVYGVSGTSASAPVFAGVLTLVNNERFNRGKASVGFVNPALYNLFEKSPSIYNDVTSGNNKCTASSICCDNGFYCTSGWDPVTGLGSVNVGKFVDGLASY